jgi:hypothetical protein
MPENSGDSLQTTLSIAKGGCKPEAVSHPGLQAILQKLPVLSRRNRRRPSEPSHLHKH